MGDRSLAEELTAQAFEKAFRKRSLFKPGRGDLRGWLFGIARNAAIDELRRGGRESALESRRSRPARMAWIVRAKIACSSRDARACRAAIANWSH